MNKQNVTRYMYWCCHCCFFSFTRLFRIKQMPVVERRAGVLYCQRKVSIVYFMAFCIIHHSVSFCKTIFTVAWKYMLCSNIDININHWSWRVSCSISSLRLVNDAERSREDGETRHYMMWLAIVLLPSKQPTNLGLVPCSHPNKYINIFKKSWPRCTSARTPWVVHWHYQDVSIGILLQYAQTTQRLDKKTCYFLMPSNH